jgi:prepilin-type N-terminal cleavage/methylation domain-containing protein
MYKNRSQGFTLIELLVVIAIIGVLSAVVLASLNSARSKGTDAAIQSDLSTIQVQAEIFASNNSNRYNTNGTTAFAIGACSNTGNTLFADTTIWNAIQAAAAANGGGLANTKCILQADGSAYAVEVQSKVTTTNYFCVDSTGFATTTTFTALTNSKCQ